MFGTQQTVGQVVDNLIAVKDRFANQLCGAEIDAINDACNILDHRCNRFDTAEYVINEYVGGVHWHTGDIERALAEDGYEPCNENVAIICNSDRFNKNLEERSIEDGWDVIHAAINMCKDELLILQGDGLEE